MGIPAALSSVPAQTPYIQYVATNGQTVFPYPFEITQDSDLVVVVNGVTLNTDSGYSLSGQGTTGGGNVTFILGQTTGAIVTLFRDIPIQRITQIAQNSGFSSTAFNAEFNNIYLLLQQLQESLGFCLQIPNTNTPAPVTTLTPAAYANKYQAYDSNGNPTPALLTTSGSLTQAIINALLYPTNVFPPIYVQTAAELAASVVPVNYFYPAGVVDRYKVNTTPGTTDMTAAMTAAFNQMVKGGAPVQFLGETYLHTGATSPMIITNAYQGAVIFGVPLQTIIINQGTANSCPTIKVYGGSYFDISGLLISGRAGYSNPGIQVIDDGTYRCGFGRITKCIGFTNNVQNGFIDIVNANTMYLEDIDYWPTSSSFEIPDGGATIDNNGQFAAIYLHGGSTAGSLSGNTNDIHIHRMNTSGINQSATFTGSVGGATSGTLTAAWPGGNGVFPFMFENGQQKNVTISGAGSTAATWTGALSAGTITQAPNGATILVDGETGGVPAFGTIVISEVEAERALTQSVWFRHVWNSSVSDMFLEGSNVTLDNNCNRVALENLDAAGATLLIDGTQTAGGNTRIDIKQVDCKYYLSDAANSYINEQNLNVVTTYTQNGLYVTSLNVTPPGNGAPDRVGAFGLALGANTNPGFGASLSNGGTIGGAVSGGTVYSYSPAGAVTGAILAPPINTTVPAIIKVINESANSITFAAVGTSNVADGASAVIAAKTHATFVWSPHTTVWYHD